MKQIGIVEKTENGRATVSVARASACGGCHRYAEGCSACSLLGGDNRHTATAANPIGATVGDHVELEADDRRILTYAALVFVFPLVAAFVAYLIGTALLGEGIPALLCTAGGFVLSFAAVFLVSLSLSKKTPAVTIVNVIKHREEEDSAFPSNE
ncbi:MAG: SoxR reducing system RseC family protein [Clostridia bacterium]|nr:SoxR reducing system RseC family protein [Clostridia bacterium]